MLLPCSALNQSVRGWFVGASRLTRRPRGRCQSEDLGAAGQAEAQTVRAAENHSEPGTGSRIHLGEVRGTSPKSSQVHHGKSSPLVPQGNCAVYLLLPSSTSTTTCLTKIWKYYFLKGNASKGSWQWSGIASKLVDGAILASNDTLPNGMFVWKLADFVQVCFQTLGRLKPRESRDDLGKSTTPAFQSALRSRYVVVLKLVDLCEQGEM